MNVLRARAGRWTYSNAEYKEVDRDFSAEMTAATPATIDINYILDERSREFYGEGYRWFDLVRTQKWNEYADSYVICGGKGDHNPQTYSRTIEAFHYLRPIPQGQLDGMEMTEEGKRRLSESGIQRLIFCFLRVPAVSFCFLMEEAAVFLWYGLLGRLSSSHRIYVFSLMSMWLPSDKFTVSLRWVSLSLK